MEDLEEEEMKEAWEKEKMKDLVGENEKADVEKIKGLRNVQAKTEEDVKDIWKEGKMKDVVGEDKKAYAAKNKGLGNVQENA